MLQLFYLFITVELKDNISVFLEQLSKIIVYSIVKGHDPDIGLMENWTFD